MKTFNKYIASALIASAALSYTACTDLDETLYDTISEEQYEFTDKDVQSMFGPVYSSLCTAYWGWFGYNDINEMSADQWCVPYRIGIGWGDLYIPMHKHQYHSELGFFSSNWSYIYSGVNACNKMMANEMVQESEESMSQLRAYRALYYYMLFDLFRNIPLDTTYEHEPGWLPEQATPQETYDFIVSELNDIKGKCGNDVQLSKINNYTVNMLLAKMYINHNAWFNDHSDNSYYGKAIDELNEIIESGRFSLAPKYLDNFREKIGNSPEVIFGIPCEEKYQGGNYMANLWMHEAGRATWEFSGWATGGGAALPQFLDTYDVDDQRYTDCWISGQQYTKSGAPIYVENDPLVYTRELHSIDLPGCYPFESERMVKYEICSGDKGTSTDDQVVFRYAEVLLMKAECLLRLGGYKGESEQLAADLVTEVRRRNFPQSPGKAVRTVAQLKGGSCYKYGHRENQGVMGEEDKWIITEEGGDDIILGGLLDEYAWEFVGECVRRQTLIRFQMTNGQNVWNGKSWFCKDRIENIYDNHYNIFPIPKDAMDGNPKLKQNPGYAGAAE